MVDTFIQFKSYIKGAVIYDINVYSSALVASTLAGAQDLLPIAGRPEGTVY